MARKTVIFDFDGVISDSRFWHEDVARVISKHTGASFSRLSDWIVMHGNRLWLHGLWDDSEFVDRLAADFDITITDEMMREAMRATMHINPEVKELLEKINADILIYTDNPKMRIEEIERQLPMVRKVIYSQELLGNKRDVRAFSKAIKENHIKSGTLFIDDNEGNRQVAENLGLMPIPFVLGDFPVWQLKLLIEYYLE